MEKLVYILIIFLFENIGFSQNQINNFTLEAPLKTDSLQKLNLWATQYYIHQFTSSGKIPVVFEDGQNRQLFGDTCDFCTAALEGTAYITDSTGKVVVINYASHGDTNWVDCRKCKKFQNSKLDVESWGRVIWKVSNAFGNGVQNYQLIPYRTIAVDPNIIPYGSVVYVPKAKGDSIQMPNGEIFVHDGYFFAGDTGGAIKKNHIDIFTGIYAQNPFKDFLFSNPDESFEAFFITNEKIIQYFDEISRK